MVTDSNFQVTAVFFIGNSAAYPSQSIADEITRQQWLVESVATRLDIVLPYQTPWSEPKFTARVLISLSMRRRTIGLKSVAVFNLVNARVGSQVTLIFVTHFLGTTHLVVEVWRVLFCS